MASITLLQTYFNSSKKSYLKYKQRSGFFSSKYDNLIVLGAFNAETSNTTISEFCTTYNLKSLIKEPTYFKSGQNVFKTQIILKLGYPISIN